MIVPMERVRIAASRKVADKLLSLLYENGALHAINSKQDSLLCEKDLELGAFSRDTAEKLQKAETLLLNTQTSMTFLAKLVPEHKDILCLDPGDVRVWLHDSFQNEIRTIVDKINITAERQAMLRAELEAIGEFKRIFEDFFPLVEPIASLKEIEVSGIFFPEKGVEAEQRIKEIENDLDIATQGAYSVIRSGPDASYESCLFIFSASMGNETREKVFQTLSEKAQTVHMPAKLEKETFAASLLSMIKVESELSKELKEEQELTDEYAVRWTSLLRTTEKGLKKAVNELRIANYFAFSDMTFWVTGWAPVKEVGALKTLLEKKLAGELIFYSEKPDPGEYDKVPVAFDNPAWAKPFERLLAIFPSPVYGSFDPIIIMTLSFPLLFGMMLGDLGYALLLMLIMFFIRSRKPGVALWSDISVIIGACAAASAIFGIIYGEFFGKLWSELNLFTPLFHRRDNLVQLLKVALIVGVFHIIIGNVIVLKNSITAHAYKKAVVNISDISIAGTALWIAFSIINSTSISAGVAVALVFVLLKFMFGGAKEVLELARLFTSVLSYARLMALGLASAIMADLASDFYFSSETILVGVAGAMLIHGFTFVIGVFDPAVQAIRLHYVEFFNQFYEYGSAKYSPLRSKV